MIKRYGLRRTKLPVSGVIAPDIVECEDGEYVKIGDYMQVQDALKNLIDDLEMRSLWKNGRDKGVVDCGNGVYINAKRALGEL